MIKRQISTAIVTGPTGCIGTALCQKLLDAGVTTFAVVRPGCKRLSGLPNGVNIIECELASLADLSNRIESADAFFHLAWAHTIGAGRNDMPAQIDNIRYAIDAVSAAAKMNCKVFVGAGSQAECGRVEGFIKSDTPCFPENGYGMAKLCAGEMTRLECERLGLDHVWMRVLSVYGPNDGPLSMISSTIKSLLRGETPSLTKGEQLWDYLYSKDAANGFYHAALSGVGGKTYPLGSGQVRPLKEYVEMLRDVIDPNLPLNFGGRPYADKQVMHLQADIAELREDTGFEPEWKFEDGVKEMVDGMTRHKSRHLC